MRLAILVVYMFQAERQGLFRIHLSKIRENTKVPYRIFAAVGHLDPELAAEVAAEPDIEALNLPVGVLPPREEHADLLDRLFREALKGDYTHFVTLHTDSFPISPDWTLDILAELESGAEFATLAPHGYTACLFWPRAFHDRHGFGLLLPHEVRAGDAFRRFMATRPDHEPQETGIGFLFGCWAKGLRWHEMRSDRRHIYGGSIFHLVAGTRFVHPDAMPVRFESLRTSFVRPALMLVKKLVPDGVWRAARRRLRDPYNRSVDGSAAEKLQELDRLLADPDGFLAGCGTQQRHGRAG